MSTYKKCDESVAKLAAEVLTSFPRHKPLLDARVGVDYIFAYPEIDDKTGESKGDALTHHGIKALGIARAVPLKDRVMGRKDAEICIDGDWWDGASDDQRRALLDHELYHFEPALDKNGRAKLDDNSRPKIRIRKHDFQFGWFACVARDHGSMSCEVHYAKAIMDAAGQYFWPELFETGRDKKAS